MSNFRDRERTLFERMRERLVNSLEFSEDQFSKWDCIDHRNELIMELKCRDKKYRRDYQDFLIERNKWEALRQTDDELGYKPLYVNEHEGDIWIYDLSRVQEPRWKELKCNAHTHFHAKGGEQITKEVGFLTWGQAARMYKNFI